MKSCNVVRGISMKSIAPLTIVLMAIGSISAVGLGDQPFRAGFESDGVREVHSVHTDKGGVVTVVANPRKDKANPTDRVVKFLTTGAAPERAEIRVKGMDALGEYWYGWQTLLPADWQPARRSDQGGGNDIITQWHRGGRMPRWARGHPMTLNTDDAGNYRLSWNYGGPDRVEKGAQLEGISAFEDREKWVNWAFHVRWAKEDTPGGGFMRLYHNGKLVFSDDGPNHENLETWMMWKSGIYHGNPSTLPTDPYVIYGDNYIMTGPEGSLEAVNPYLTGTGESTEKTGTRPETIAHPIDWDNPASPLVDFSGYLDKSAGRDGFIRVKNGRLVKPDGSRFRIWGVNMTSGFCFPAHEESEAVADDLARMGVNCVRFHGLDSNWGRSAIDQSRDDTQHLDEDNLERFDYLVWQLKKRGIYTNLNLNVFRKYKAGDGVRDFGPLYFGKSATYFNQRLIELQRDYARKLLTHKNRYTGNEYRHEPCVMCIELVNENSVLEGWVNWRLVGRNEQRPGTWSPIPVSYARELTEQFNGWLDKHYPAEKLAQWRREAGVEPRALIPRLRPDQFTSASRERFHAEAEFYFQLERQFFSMMRKLLKEELGVLPLIIGTADHNDGFCGYAHIEANMEFEAIDGHGYWQHPHLGEVTRITNTPMVNDPWDSTIIQFARTPVKGRPYTISETNHPFPHEYACEGIPALTAYAMFQDWDGIYWFCYNRGPMQKAEGIPARSWFDMSVDPVKVTQIAACAGMWHRQDIAAARKTVLRSYTHEQVLELVRSDRGRMKPFFTQGFAKTTPLMHATRFTFDGSPASDFPVEKNPDSIESDTGQLGWYDAKKQRGVIVVDTPGTQVLIGHVADSGRRTGNMRVQIANGFCCIQLSSLGDRPISASTRLLLSTTALATNTDIRWEEDRTTLASWGEAPVVIEPVTGEVILLDLFGNTSEIEVTPLTPTGRQQDAPFAVRIKNGRASLPIGEPVCTWYLLELK